jgi:hypothetical protein
MGDNGLIRMVSILIWEKEGEEGDKVEKHDNIC